MGRNGSGKSTLLQLVAGILTPTTGTVRTRGRIAALLELGSGFNPEFTGRENVYLNGAILGISRREMDEAIPAIEAFADIGDFVDQPVKTYSSGMMVRLAFAVAVHVVPDVLIIDEALSVGDTAFQMKCLARIRAMQRSGRRHPARQSCAEHDHRILRSRRVSRSWAARGGGKLSRDRRALHERHGVELRRNAAPRPRPRRRPMLSSGPRGPVAVRPRLARRGRNRPPRSSR